MAGDRRAPAAPRAATNRIIDISREQPDDRTNRTLHITVVLGANASFVAALLRVFI
jgi:hypothetical protein